MTIEPTNNQMDAWLAGVAFNAIFRENNPDKAKRRLGQMSPEKLDSLIHSLKKLMVLAESEQRMRAVRK